MMPLCCANDSINTDAHWALPHVFMQIVFSTKSLQARKPAVCSGFIVLHTDFSANCQCTTNQCRKAISSIYPVLQPTLSPSDLH